jgi:hypothetical protein
MFMDMHASALLIRIYPSSMPFTVAGCTVIRSEKITSRSTQKGARSLRRCSSSCAKAIRWWSRGRPPRQVSGATCRNIVPDLRQRGVALKAIERPIDTSTAAGR